MKKKNSLNRDVHQENKSSRSHGEFLNDNAGGLSVQPPPFQFKVNSQSNEEDKGKAVSSPFQMKESAQPQVEKTGIASKGQLPTQLQSKAEGVLGHDFSNVNIHSNSTKAKDIGALAYTQGTDVHFAPGQLNTESSAGQELVGHELTHVVQQKEGKVQATTQKKGVQINDDSGLENEADLYGRRIANTSDSGDSGGSKAKGNPSSSPSPAQMKSEPQDEKSFVKSQIENGVTSSNSLTDAVFHQRHPELKGRRLDKSEGDSAFRQEWLGIRDLIVRPALNGGSEGADNDQEASPVADIENQNQKEQDAEGEGGVRISSGAEQVMYELVAHGYAYSTTFTPEQQEVLKAWGYKPMWHATQNDNQVAGFFAGSLVPTKEGRDAGKRPIVAFRGSEMGDQFVPDWLNNDMDSYAVGYTAFMKNALEVKRMLKDAGNYGSTVVTGHSLGGSLAKQASILYPDLIQSCITFQAPGINPEQAAMVQARIDRGEHTPEVINHTAEGDIVHLAGGARMPNATEHHHFPAGFLAGHTPLAHTLYLLSSPEYEDQQNELLSMMPPGTTWDQLLVDAAGNNPEGEANNPEPITVDKPAEGLGTTAYEQVDGLRRGLISHNFHPNANIINDSTPEEISNMPLIGRINIMREFMNAPSIVETALLGALGGGLVAGLLGGVLGGIGGGVSGGIAGGPAGALAGGVGGAGVGAAAAAPVGFLIGGVALPVFAQYNDWTNTRQAILEILNCSTDKETVKIINACGGIDVVADRLGWGYQGSYHDSLTASNGYYHGLEVSQAGRLITQNLGGGFLGFGNDDQEEIIADTLIYNSNGEAIIVNVGDGDYDEGLERILRVLQGSEDRRISARFHFRERSRGWFW